MYGSLSLLWTPISGCLTPFTSKDSATASNHKQYLSMQKTIGAFSGSRILLGHHKLLSSSKISTYWRVLGVERNASQREIQKAFHKHYYLGLSWRMKPGHGSNSQMKRLRTMWKRMRSMWKRKNWKLVLQMLGLDYLLGDNLDLMLPCTDIYLVIFFFKFLD